MEPRQQSARRSGAATRSGSHFTDKQIARAVRDGKAVEVTLVDGSKRLGWVFGGDNYHWGLVSPCGEISIVHKSAPCVTILPNLLSSEPEEVRESVGALVNPYREYVMEEHFKAVPANT